MIYLYNKIKGHVKSTSKKNISVALLIINTIISVIYLCILNDNLEIEKYLFQTCTMNATLLLIFIFSSIVSYGIFFCICKGDKDIYNELLFKPVVCDFLFMFMIWNRMELDFLINLLHILILCIIIINGLISGFIYKFKIRKNIVSEGHKNYTYPLKDLDFEFIREIEIHHGRFKRLSKDLINNSFCVGIYYLCIYEFLYYAYIFISDNFDFDKIKFVFPIFVTLILFMMNVTLSILSNRDKKKAEMFEICKYLDIHNNLTDQEKKFYNRMLD